MKRVMALLLIVLLLTGCTANQLPLEDLEVLQEPAVTPPAETQPEEPEEPDDRYRFTWDDLPVLDGSTSMLPLGEAVAAVLLGEPQAAVADQIGFHRTTESFRYLMRGESDLLLVAEPNAVVFEEMTRAGFAWQMEPVAKEALVFIVNSENPVDSLTVEQLRGIYSGQITNWSQVGGNDVEIVAFQRNKTSGSQVLMDKLVMDGLEMMEAPEEWVPGEMDSLMQGVKGYEDTAAAIGYSVYYYANDMRMAEGMKILRIEDVEPTDETIGDETYPLINPYFVVIDANTAADSPTRLLFDWLLGADGQAVLESQGYVPVDKTGEGPAVFMDISGLERFTAPEEIYTRRVPERVEELVPGDYGLLRPYVGSRVAFDMTIYGNEAHLNGSMGLIDENGAIVVDPVYTKIEVINGLKLYMLAKSVVRQEGEYEYADVLYGFCSMDGSVAVPCQYTNLVESNGYLLAFLDPAGLFHIYDGQGQLLLDSADWPQQPALTPWPGYVTENLLGLKLDSKGTESWSLYDWSGNCLGEGYSWVDIGEEAPCIVYDSQWDPQYVDARGRPILENGYQSASLFCAGQALVQKDGNYAVIDLEGDVLWTPPEGTVSSYPDGDTVWYACSVEGEAVRWFDSSFRERYAGCRWAQRLTGDWFVYRDDDAVWLTDGTRTVEVPGANEISWYGYQRGDMLMLQAWGSGGSSCWVFRPDLTLLCQTSSDDTALEILSDPVDGRSVAVEYDRWAYPVIYNKAADYSGAPNLPGVNLLGIYGGWYLVEDTFSCGYMDAEGNWLFRINLMTDMVD